MEILKKKWGMFLVFLVGGKKKEIYILQKKKKKKKKKKKRKTNSSIWDLISFPHRWYFSRFTDVCTHIFLLKRRLYNT